MGLLGGLCFSKQNFYILGCFTLALEFDIFFLALEMIEIRLSETFFLFFFY